MPDVLIPDIDEARIERLVDTFLRGDEARSHLQLQLGLDREGFLAFCGRHPDLLTELEPDGTVTVMSPLVFISSDHEEEAYDQLKAWWRRARVGRVKGASAGFTLPSGAVKAPDVAWISPERIAAVDAEDFEHFPRLVPDFVIEVRSKTDRLKKAKAKMTDTWLDAGVRLAWLIDPREQHVYVYRPGAEVETVSDFSGKLSADEVVPGFEMDLTEFV